MRRIVLLRHGNPDFKRHWLKPSQDVKLALDAYAASRVTIACPDKLRDLKSSVNVCVTSDLSRSIDSARLLGFRNIETFDMFNEAELPYPTRLFFPVPWSLFLTVYRVLWFIGFKGNSPGKLLDCERAQVGGQYLSDLAEKNISVLLVGHGVMNRLLCRDLRKRGWQLNGQSGSGYWSSMTLTYQMPDQ